MADNGKAKLRGNSKPNVKRRGSTYTYYVYVTGPDGRRRQHSKGGFKTQREAEEARIAAEYALAKGTYVKAERISLGDFLVDEWLPTRRPPVLEESTWHSYDLNKLYRLLLESGRHERVSRPVRPPEVRERALALRADGLTYEQVAEHLRVEFEDEAQISKDAVAALIRRQTNETREPSAPSGLSPRTVRYVHTILHAALADALRWNLVARNVSEAATPPPTTAARAKRPQTWTAEQLRAFLDYASDSPYLPAWIFLATSGCRRGECLGLRWNDVDLDESTAIIARQVTALDHRVIVKELPKTKQAHLIRLDSGTVSMLRKLRAEQADIKLGLGAGYHDEGYIFCRADGRPHHPERFSREFDRNQRYFNRDNPDQPIPTITLHGLRHTWATLALTAGIDIKIVSERLNHSSTHITREIYTHVTPPMQSDAAERVAAVIRGPSSAFRQHPAADHNM